MSEVEEGNEGIPELWNDEELSMLVPNVAFQAQSTLSHSIFFLPSLSFPDNDDGDSSWQRRMQHSLNAAWTNQSMGYLDVQLEHSLPALILIPLFPSCSLVCPWKKPEKCLEGRWCWHCWVSRVVFSKHIQGSLKNSFGVQPSAITLTVVLSPGKGDNLRCHSGTGFQSDFLWRCPVELLTGKHGWEAPPSLSSYSYLLPGFQLYGFYLALYYLEITIYFPSPR